MTNDIQVHWARSGDILIARPAGRIYSSEYLDWLSKLESGIAPGDTKLIVSLEQVPYVSSAGLRILLLLAKRFTGPDRFFAICGSGRLARKVLAASGFDAILKVYDSEEIALAEIQGSGDEG